MGKWPASTEQHWPQDQQDHAHKLLSLASLVIAIIGGLGSVGLLLRAGGRNPSLLLLAMVATWVLSPFVALLLVCKISKRRLKLVRVALFVLTLCLAVGSLAIYINVAAAPRASKVAFPFIVVPLGSWILLVTVVPLAARSCRRPSSIGHIGLAIRAIAGSTLLAILGIIALLGLLLLDHNRDTALPPPTGPFAIGRATFVWGDEQLDPLAPPGVKRELLVWIWYPAAPEQHLETVEYLPAYWRTAVENQSGVLLSQFLTRDLARVQAHSLRDAEVSPQLPAYPVVLMRGGGAASTTDYTSLAEDLASHGYVVVGFDAPYRSWLVALPDGRVIPRAPENDLDKLDGPQAEKLTNNLVQAWTADASFVLDRLERLNESDPTGKFRGRLDLQRVGMFGHSLGGATALLFCHDDVRCKAGIDVDGAPLGRVIAEGVTQPFMFILGDHGRESATAQTPASIRDARKNIHSIFDRLPGNRRMMIEIQGANHFLFSDNGALLKSPLAMSVLRMLGIVRLDGRRQIAVTSHCIRRFFDVYLNDAPASELKSQLASPEIEFVP